MIHAQLRDLWFVCLLGCLLLLLLLLLEASHLLLLALALRLRLCQLLLQSLHLMYKAV